ncbi:toll/interleukin-1 receptor domain-containing protein [Streptomyces sp. NPDC005799]|uniref:toll/interleukin-1 receptor domain-containing protein n=1 Tax=Streptomyces sp. NPDC005799 TaxID=3154678 RepID=UPI0033C62BAF
MLKVFLCHSSGDKPDVRLLRTMLQSEGFEPWLDEEEILPGQDWDLEIRRAIRASDLILVCLSKASVTKTGYVQKEIRIVLDEADHQPEGTIYLIPARLENCDVPERLRRWQWVDLFTDDGYGKLLRSLHRRADWPVTRSTRAPARPPIQVARTAPVPIDAPSPTTKYPGTVRYDGFYEKANDESTTFLRFYSDGTVLSVGSIGTASQIVSWFNRNHSAPSKGTYDINGSHIKFATTSESGTVEYTGTIGDDGVVLHLHVLSHINGYEADGLWRFSPVRDMHEDSPAKT